MDNESETKEYSVSVRTNDIRDAIAKTGSALYDLLEQALMTTDDEDESYFVQFARETFNVLGIHAEQLSDDPEWRETELVQDDPNFPGTD